MYITIYTQDSLYLESVYFYISNIYSTRAILLLESFFFVIFFKFFSNFPAVACCCCCCWWCYYSSNNIGLPLPHFEFLLATFLTHSIMLLFLLSRQMFHFQLLQTSCSFYFFFFFFFFFFFLFSFFSSQQGLYPIIFHGNLFFFTFVLSTSMSVALTLTWVEIFVFIRVGIKLNHSRMTLIHTKL